MTRFEVRIHFEDQIVVLRLSGCLTVETTSILQTVMDTLVDVIDAVVFDFAALDTVDDFGIDLLEEIMTNGCAAGWRVGVRNTRRDPSDIERRYGLRDLVMDSLDVD